MKKSGFSFAVLGILSIMSPARSEITVAVAANMQYAMEEIRTAFQKQTAIEVKPVYGASGKLAVQIKSGAPFDAFVSADTNHPDSLVRWGLAATPPKVYAYGKLVLWTLKDLDLSKGLPVLLDAKVFRIALADSGRAPYGAEAAKALGKAGLREKLNAKLVFGESISQVNQYILTGNAEAGFTSKSTVVAEEMRGKGHWVDVDSTLYGKIAQGAVACKHGSKSGNTETQRFLAFLQEDAARKILARYGYALP